ncbi:MAG: hypothetical protein IPH05_08125 [Flavobacteriales bacterium]|jgi:hypothetical protein|nr:hypothetical protein [Flavobacteriales bacterium]MBK6550546.1 hypothetical protein [Flavobacteriales bacterium]MBK6882897.1 hypothetical protein [Flavobacteriales bacterium]MBK7101884.1 hypothetical protein [Flavobacteriales bacterium]MBK7114234.1 hypothetical protein [Flavobacteriales bacterium]
MSAGAMHENDEILFHEPFLMVSYCAEQNMIMLRWNGYASPENYKRGMTFVADQVIAKKITYWLNDLRNMTAILQPEETWTNEVWFPRLLAGCVVKKMAFLPAADFFNQMSVDRIMDRTIGARSFQVGYFPSEKEALHWLMNEVHQHRV